jgi:hypothetical protein
MGHYEPAWVEGVVDLAVTKSVSASEPDPTAIRLAEVGKEPILEFLRKVLRKDVLWPIVSLHNKFSLLCRAPGCCNSAGAI